jgi:hypothetical protein
MSDAPRLRTLAEIIYELTEAQWAVNDRIFGTIIATASGSFVPRFCSEVGASAITVTNVIGMLKRTA